MATQVEEIRLRMGWDAKEVARGTAVMLANQENTAAKTKAIWAEADRVMELEYKSAIEGMILQDEKFKNAKISISQQIKLAEDTRNAEIVATEKAAADERIAIWTKYAASREAISAQIAAAQNAETVITPGSGSSAIPANMAGAAESNLLNDAGIAGGTIVGTLGAKYAYDKFGKLRGKVAADGKSIIDAAGNAIKEADAAAGEAKTFTQAWNEFFVLIREGFRHAGMSRILASFMRMMSLGLGSTIMRPIRAIGRIPGMGILGPIGDALSFFSIGKLGYEAWKLHKDHQTEAESKTNAAAGLENEIDPLRQHIEMLRAAGLIDKITADNFSNQLRRPHNVNSIFAAVEKLMPSGGLRHLENMPEMQRLDEEHAKKMLEFNRDDLKTTQDRYTFDLLQKHILEDKLKNSTDEVEQKKIRNQLDDANHLVNQDLKDLEKEKAEAAKKTADEKERAKMADLKDKISGFMQGAEYPSLEDLAGRDYTTRLNKMYGKGGIYDLGRGNGPFASIAQDAELAQKQQQWDRIHGNVGQPDLDRQRFNMDVDKLIHADAASPQQLLSKILETAGSSKAALDLIHEKLSHVGLDSN